MLAALIPLFDEHMMVRAYSAFAQKDNFLLHPGLLGTGRYDNAGDIAGMELVDSCGIKTLSDDRMIFIEVNQISVFADIDAQCQAPHDKIVLLMDSAVTPDQMYVDRLRALRASGYRLAIRKLRIQQFEPYREILRLMDYILLDHKKINIESARIYFTKVYPNIRLIAVHVDSQEDFDALTQTGGYTLYEGSFFRQPKLLVDQEIAPLKVNYIELLNVVNAPDFDLQKAADVIGHDTALVISLLEMVNHMTVNSEITSVRHAAAMLGQRELKKWINTAVTRELCSDRPSEITRLSLLRAKFAENLAPVMDMSMQAPELFLMGLFSVLDVILDKTMEEALQMVKVSKPISDALLKQSGDLFKVLNFEREYENASWQEVSRLMILDGIEMNDVYKAYLDALKWYRDLLDIRA